jgi:hypothetical protein
MKFKKHPQLTKIRGKYPWFWFMDSALQRPVVFVTNLDSFEKARPWWREFVGDPSVLDAEGDFAGMHVELRNDRLLLGSVIFISDNAPDIVAHEIVHGVHRHLAYQSISDEEAHATFVSGWMKIFESVIGWKKS